MYNKSEIITSYQDLCRSLSDPLNTNTHAVFDSKRFKEFHPRLYNQFVRQAETKRFSVAQV